jgi:ParB/RepB/Spo0J family partition protein
MTLSPFNKSTKSSGVIATSIPELLARDAELQAAIKRGPGGLSGSFSAPVKGDAMSSAMDAIDSIASGMEVVTPVDLDLIDHNPQNSRTRYTEDQVAQMWDEIQRSDGIQLVPIILMVSEVDKDRYWCIDGMTRVLALKKGGRTTAKAVIRGSIGPLERYVASFMTNNAHRKTSDYDDGIVWSRMLADGTMVLEDIKKLVGADRSPHISRILSIGKLTGEIQEFISTNHDKVTSNFYWRLHKLMSGLTSAGMNEFVAAKKTFETLVAVVGDDISIRQLDAIVDKEISAAELLLNQDKNILGTDASASVNKADQEDKTEPTVSRRSIDFKGKTIGHVREWTQGKIEIKVQDKHASLRDLIRDKISEVIEEYINTKK